MNNILQSESQSSDCKNSSTKPCYFLSLENFENLKAILECYADDNNYMKTTRRCEWITNGVTEETFYEFDGDSSNAKKGLKILDSLGK